MPHAYLMGLPGAETMIEPWLFMNYKRSMEYLYRRQKLTAVEALDMGLVNHVVTRDELESTVEGIAEEIAMFPLTALQGIKLTVKRAWEMMGFRLHQQWSNDMLALASRHTDFHEHFTKMLAETGGKSK